MSSLLVVRFPNTSEEILVHLTAYCNLNKWLTTMCFQIKNECLACRNSVAVFNMSYFGKFYLSGPDAQKAADWLFTADVNKAEGKCSEQTNGRQENMPWSSLNSVDMFYNIKQRWEVSTVPPSVNKSNCTFTNKLLFAGLDVDWQRYSQFIQTILLQLL